MTQQGNESPQCHGNGAQHCCYLPGSGIPDPAGSGMEVCPLLEIGTMPGRHWVCAAKRVHGTWAKAHRDRAYRDRVKPVWTARGVPDCGDWRVEGQCCFGPNNPPIHNQ